MTASAHTVRPFRVEAPQRELDELQARLARTRWAAPAGEEYGVPLPRLRRLVEYWRTDYDWRVHEARLNSYPQFVTDIDGQPIHFLHIRSARPDAIALILTHGWPGSVIEYLDLIGPLTEPARPSDLAFDLVIPSLPGFAFSGPALAPGWGTHRTAQAWARLMARLGYDRYGAVGNDAGSMISPEIGRHDADHLLGVHVTQLYSFPTGAPGEMDDLSTEEKDALGVLSWFWERKGAFNTLHSQQPQTIAHALSDSPAGLLAWHAQLFDDTLAEDFILTNTMLYWLTGTASTAIRFYYETANEPRPTRPTTVPLALAAAADGDFKSIRRFAERDHAAIASWHVLARVAGHYAAHTHPDALAADIRAFFTGLTERTQP